jgi:hypothetical protein
MKFHRKPWRVHGELKQTSFLSLHEVRQHPTQSYSPPQVSPYRSQTTTIIASGIYLTSNLHRSPHITYTSKMIAAMVAGAILNLIVFASTENSGFWSTALSLEVPFAAVVAQVDLLVYILTGAAGVGLCVAYFEEGMS